MPAGRLGPRKHTIVFCLRSQIIYKVRAPGELDPLSSRREGLGPAYAGRQAGTTEVYHDVVPALKHLVKMSPRTRT